MSQKDAREVANDNDDDEWPFMVKTNKNDDDDDAVVIFSELENVGVNHDQMSEKFSNKKTNDA